MKLRITFKDMKSLDIDLPDDKVESVLAACGRGIGWSSADLGFYLDGKDVRSVHKIDTLNPARPESGDAEGWVDIG